MEVYIQQLDSKTSREDLHESLRAILAPFDVTVFDTRKPTGRTFAFLTIADSTKAQRFLATTLTTPFILVSPSGRPAKFQLSKKPPNEHVVRLLQKHEKDAQARVLSRGINPTQHRKQADSAPAGSLAFSQIESGHWEGQHFVSFWACHTEGTLSKSSKALKITTNDGVEIDVLVDLLHVEDLTISTLGNLTTILLTLAIAPKIFERPPSSDGNSIIQALELLALRKPVSYRDTKFPSSDQLTTGSCLVYRLTLEPGFEQGNLKRRLQNMTSHQHSISRLPGPAQPNPTLTLADHLNAIDVSLAVAGYSWALKFQIQALWANGLMSPRQVRQLLPEIHARRNRYSEGKLISVLRRLALQIRFADLHSTLANDALAIIQRVEESFLADDRHLIPKSRSTRDEVSIHRVTITPTGIYLAGPEEVASNRILRKHRKNDDCFIRVTFAEEDESRIEFNREISNERIFRGRFLQILDRGLDVAGEHFDFLGFSHSSLRAQSCWFMRPFKYEGARVDAKSLIASLGDFSSIRCPAKCAARIGQAFSETHSAISIDPSLVQIMPDIKHARHTFTDGCGTISETLWKRLKSSSSSKLQPTLYQIRYKGAKGMISLDTRLPGEQLRLRPSMIKFIRSPSNDIEICGTNARPLPFKFNRPLIKILEDLKVPAHAFEDLQSQAVENLRNSTTSFSTAIQFLSTQLSDSATGLPALLQTLAREEIDVIEDSFLREILGALLQVQLRALKYRARIPVPGALTLYGICDETNYLNEGEVFVTFKPDNSIEQHLTGRVVVTRSPALHPGDVQRVAAVAPPENSCLWDLTNCVVFSSKGVRDLPSMLSGGDLDGDLYNVIYDQSLLPKQIAHPAEYLPVEPVELDGPVQTTDMTKFFVDFMQNDQLGRIATLHQVFADREGTYSMECLQLAELHSTAVDFSKSGVPVNLQKIPKSPSERPDFMAPSASTPVENGIKRPNEPAVDAVDGVQRFTYYRSERVLGRLFRAIDEDIFFESLEHDTSSVFSQESAENVLTHVWNFVEEATQGTNWQKYMTLAEEVRDYYEENILEIMSQYAGVRTNYLTEKECFIGTIIGRSGAGSRFQREQSELMKSRFNRDLRDIRAWMEDNTEGDADEFQCLAIACLCVAVKKPSGTTAGKRVHL